jgi:hypothetical protein
LKETESNIDLIKTVRKIAELAIIQKSTLKIGSLRGYSRFILSFLCIQSTNLKYKIELVNKRMSLTHSIQLSKYIQFDPNSFDFFESNVVVFDNVVVKIDNVGGMKGAS